MYGISQMFSILLQTIRGILNTLICVAHFSNNFNSIFNEKVENIIVVLTV